MLFHGSHLTYCLNIHPGETWEENLTAIRRYASDVKRRVSPEGAFGLGIRLSACAAAELLPIVDDFREYLEKVGMYVFTINGFPYGRFHGAPVKENVYKPDWSTVGRLDYTKTLAKILAAILPDGMDGSINTVPVAYGKGLPREAVANLIDIARFLERLEARTGKTVRLALEPEPDCYLEFTHEVVSFFDLLREQGIGDNIRFLGVCLDTSHVACNFEVPVDALQTLRKADVPVPKVQLSAALSVNEGVDARNLLAPFADPVYLHQTRVLSHGRVLRYPDLPDAFREAPDGQWRVHFHVPLHFEQSGSIGSTSDLLCRRFFDESIRRERHLEIETYTFDLLPDQHENVIGSVVSEFEWVNKASVGCSSSLSGPL